MKNKFAGIFDGLIVVKQSLEFRIGSIKFSVTWPTVVSQLLSWALVIRYLGVTRKLCLVSLGPSRNSRV